MKSLTENAEERKLFDESSELLGGPLHAIIAILSVWRQTAPEPQRNTLSIVLNELYKLIPEKTE